MHALATLPVQLVIFRAWRAKIGAAVSAHPSLKIAWLGLPVAFLAGLFVLSQRKVAPPPEPKPAERRELPGIQFPGQPPGVAPYAEREPEPPPAAPGTPLYEASEKLKAAQAALNEARNRYNTCIQELNRSGYEAANQARAERQGQTDYYSKEGARRAYEVKRRECEQLEQEDRAAQAARNTARQEYDAISRPR